MVADDPGRERRGFVIITLEGVSYTVMNLHMFLLVT